MPLPERFLIIGDPHGEELNHDVAESLFAFAADFKPHLVIHGGDNWNFSYMRKGASASEEGANADADWEVGSEFFLRYMALGSTRVFLRGNHDERLWKTYREATKETTRRHAKDGIDDIEALVKKRRVRMLPYDSRQGVLDINGVRVIHGYAHGVGSARAHAASFGTCAYCHTHATDVAAFERWPEPSIAYGVGCLLNIDQDYNSSQRNKLRHENAWLCGYTDGTRATYMQVRRGANGQFHAPTQIKAY